MYTLRLIDLNQPTRVYWLYIEVSIVLKTLPCNIAKCLCWARKCLVACLGLRISIPGGLNLHLIVRKVFHELFEGLSLLEELRLIVLLILSLLAVYHLLDGISRGINCVAWSDAIRLPLYIWVFVLNSGFRSCTLIRTRIIVSTVNAGGGSKCSSY